MKETIKDLTNRRIILLGELNSIEKEIYKRRGDFNLGEFSLMMVKKYGDAVLSESRKREIIIIKQVAQYLLRKEYGYTLVFIGKIFNCTHTTVLSNVKKTNQFLDLGYDDYKREVLSLKTIILNCITPRL